MKYLLFDCAPRSHYLFLAVNTAQKLFRKKKIIHSGFRWMKIRQKVADILFLNVNCSYEMAIYVLRPIKQNGKIGAHQLVAGSH